MCQNMILIKCNANSVYFFTGLLIFVVAIALNITSINCHGLHFNQKTSNNTQNTGNTKEATTLNPNQRQNG